MSKADKKKPGTVGKQSRSGGRSPATATDAEQARAKDGKGGDAAPAKLPKVGKGDVGGGKSGGGLH